MLNTMIVSTYSVISQVVELFRWHLKKVKVIDIDHPDYSIGMGAWRNVFCADLAWLARFTVEDVGNTEMGYLKAL